MFSLNASLVGGREQSLVDDAPLFPVLKRHFLILHSVRIRQICSLFCQATDSFVAVTKLQSFVTIHACDRRTDRRRDGQKDRILLAIPRLHYMQRGKNQFPSFQMHLIWSALPEKAIDNAVKDYRMSANGGHLEHLM